MPRRILPIVVLAAACANEPQVSREERLLEAAVDVSLVSQWFLGATTALQVEASIRADLADPTCLTVDASAGDLTAHFDGCVTLGGDLAIDGTLVATFGGLDWSVVIAGDGLIVGDLELDGAWQIGLLATWTGDLVVTADGDSVEAQIRATMQLLGLCLSVSIDATAASASITVDGLLTCPDGP